MHGSVQARARLDEFVGSPHCLQVVNFVFQVHFHVLHQLGQRSFRQTFDVLFIAVKDYWVLAVAQDADPISVLHQFCCIVILEF
jgi:hypothetical protein